MANYLDEDGLAEVWAKVQSLVGNSVTGITRSGTTFTATRANGDTFTFTQQDNNTTYSLASTSSNGLLRKLTGSTTDFMRADGTWAAPSSSSSSGFASFTQLYFNSSGTTGTVTLSDTATIALVMSNQGVTVVQNDTTSYLGINGLFSRSISYMYGPKFTFSAKSLTPTTWSTQMHGWNPDLDPGTLIVYAVYKMA